MCSRWGAGVAQVAPGEVVLLQVRSYWAQFRLMAPVLVLSAFLNNTPIVSLLTPIVLAWSTRTGVHKKKMLVPLFYASIFGGTITVIGTSTNLVIAGYYQKTYGLAMGIFEIARWGVPYAISGLAYTLVASKFLLAGDDNAGQANEKKCSLQSRRRCQPGAARLLAATLRQAGR